MSWELEEIKDETSNDFVELCSVLKCELISETDIEVEILDRRLEADHNITDLVPVKLEEHENLYDSDVSIKEESFETCQQSINEDLKTDFNATHDIQSDSCDRNKDVAYSNDEEFSTHIEFTTQNKKTVKKTKTVNSRNKRSGRKKDDVLFSCGICSKFFSTSKDFFSHSHSHDLRKSEKKLQIEQQISGCISRTAKTQANKKKSHLKFKTVAHMRETLNNSKIKHTSKQYDVKTKTTSKKRKMQHCDQCGQIFTFYNNLVRHKKKHSDGRVVCDYCQKDYNRKSYLAEHIKDVHLKIARNNSVFMCTLCNKSLKSLYALRCHMRIHTGKKPFRCDVCKNEFSNKWNFEVHCKSKKHNCSLKS